MPYSDPMGVIQELAAELGAEERTLRRAASQGAVRCRRPRPRQLRLESGEREYLRDNWQLLAELRRALRTQRRVRLAVLYGSLARGDGDADSDLDLLVALGDDRPLASTQLSTYLEESVDRQVDVARLERVQADAPLLLDRVLAEGRVLVDRDGRWPELLSQRRAIRARAQRTYERQMAAASAAIEEHSPLPKHP